MSVTYAHQVTVFGGTRKSLGKDQTMWRVNFCLDSEQLSNHHFTSIWLLRKHSFVHDFRDIFSSSNDLIDVPSNLTAGLIRGITLPMSPTRVARPYQETRLNLHPATSNTVVGIALPVPRSLSLSSQTSPKRRKGEGLECPQDESSFARDHLASESSIHFRSIPHTRSQSRIPRTILWRVLDDRTVLELQATDLDAHQDEHRETVITLRFKLPNALVPGGIAFTESQTKNVDHPLVVFALTGLCVKK